MPSPARFLNLSFVAGACATTGAWRTGADAATGALSVTVGEGWAPTRVVLRHSRRALCDDKVVEVSRTVYRADRFTLWVQLGQDC